MGSVLASNAVRVEELVADEDSSRASREVAPIQNLRSYETAKRSFDLLGALLLLTLLLPVMILVAIAVKLTSRGPAIYVQRRLTRGGKVFSMFKFRTMRVDAEANSGPVWAQHHDPRITPIGRFLRASRLDELPQLVNVLLGDMSLIGPRPERPEMAAELAKELPDFNRRLEVRGGITGLAQVSSGYAACSQSYRRKLALDITYVNNRSLRLDCVIAAKTIAVMFTGFGAR